MDDNGRKTSAIAFPYVDLDEGASVAKAVRDKGGSRLALDQLAFALGHSTVDSGGFRLKVAGARLFGLVTGGRGPVELTALGHDIADSAREARARATAFLEVPLYRRTFEAYRGRQLPPDSGLEAEFVSWGVPEKSAAKARQVFQRSAQQAGFFAYGKDRLAEPAFGNLPEERQESQQEQPARPEAAPQPLVDPLIEGLVKQIPSVADGWSVVRRKMWLETARHVFDLLYGAADVPEAKKVESD